MLVEIVWISLALGAQPGAGEPHLSTAAQGKALYGVNCSFCHGSDARGGEGGPNLLRSQVVLEDKDGELIAPVVANGRPKRGMPKFAMTAAQVSEIAAYLHSFPVNTREPGRFPPSSILAGDAKAGEAYFNTKCAGCHSATGDLKGIASKITDPKSLQNTFIMPENAPPATVTVESSGGKVEGRLVLIDDFSVTLIEPDGHQLTLDRDGDEPKVEIHDPLQPHKDLLRSYTDRDIHNLTAYLATLK